MTMLFNTSLTTTKYLHEDNLERKNPHQQWKLPRTPANHSWSLVEFLSTLLEIPKLKLEVFPKNISTYPLSLTLPAQPILHDGLTSRMIPRNELTLITSNSLKAEVTILLQLHKVIYDGTWWHHMLCWRHILGWRHVLGWRHMLGWHHILQWRHIRYITSQVYNDVKCKNDVIFKITLQHDVTSMLA